MHAAPPLAQATPGGLADCTSMRYGTYIRLFWVSRVSDELMLRRQNDGVRCHHQEPSGVDHDPVSSVTSCLIVICDCTQ